jgi:hypothetical protein
MYYLIKYLIQYLRKNELKKLNVFSLNETAPPHAIHTFNDLNPLSIVEMASLAATASVAEDHSRCGAECSLKGLAQWQMDYVKPSFRIYDTTTSKVERRVSTAVPLKDGTVLQVFPEKRHFATLEDWRRSYPLAWETRRPRTFAERTVDVGGIIRYTDEREMPLATLVLEVEEEVAASPAEAAAAAAEAFASMCRALDKMGYAPPLTKVQMAIIRDALQASV